MNANVVATFLAIASAYVCSASAEGQELDRQTLQGKWVLSAIDGVPVAVEKPAYFEIEGNVISGFDGCNLFGGNLDNPASMRATLRACAEQTEYLDLRDLRTQLSGASIEADVLRLPAADGKALLEFERD